MVIFFTEFLLDLINKKQTTTPDRTKSRLNGKMKFIPNCFAISPTKGPEMPSDISMNRPYAPNAAPLLAAEALLTASTPSAGNTIEKPKPVIAAPIIVRNGEGAKEMSNKPKLSITMQKSAILIPPILLMLLVNTNLPKTNIVLKQVIQSAALSQPL